MVDMSKKSKDGLFAILRDLDQRNADNGERKNPRELDL